MTAVVVAMIISSVHLPWMTNLSMLCIIRKVLVNNLLWKVRFKKKIEKFVDRRKNLWRPKSHIRIKMRKRRAGVNKILWKRFMKNLDIIIMHRTSSKILE